MVQADPALTLLAGTGLAFASALPGGNAGHGVDSKVTTTGVVVATYEPAGKLVTGSFAD